MSGPPVENLEQRFRQVKEEVADRAAIVAVSKTRGADAIRHLASLGQKDFGENRVAELQTKANELQGMGIAWHFLGHIQSRKMTSLLQVPGLVAIHSVDSLRLLERIVRFFERRRPFALKLFLQVNTSGEKAKGGLVELEELYQAYDIIAQQLPSQVQLSGLMTMATWRTDRPESEAKRCFSQLRALRDQLDPGLALSMGMSGDYSLALEEGSDYVRLGSALFGPREET